MPSRHFSLSECSRRFGVDRRSVRSAVFSVAEAVMQMQARSAGRLELQNRSDCRKGTSLAESRSNDPDPGFLLQTVPDSERGEISELVRCLV